MPRKDWVSLGGFRGYAKPKYAIAGASDTGMWNDSPNRSDLVSLELSSMASYLRQNGVKVRQATLNTSNSFTVKRWLVSAPQQFQKARRLSAQYLKSHPTAYLHG